MKVVAIFKNPIYILISVVVSLLIFGFGIWLPLKSIIGFFFKVNPSFFQSILFTVKSLPQLVLLNIPKLPLILLAITALLAGLNTSLVLYYFRQRARLYRESGLGIVGMISGVVGVCCTSCGSIIISSLLGVSAAGTVLGLLPFKGLEFSLLAIVILLSSVYLVAQKIVNPAACRIKK